MKSFHGVMNLSFKKVYFAFEALDSFFKLLLKKKKFLGLNLISKDWFFFACSNFRKDILSLRHVMIPVVLTDLSLSVLQPEE